jgi:hypothetical protein
VFALENDLAFGSSILHWSPCGRLGVNLGSKPISCQKRLSGIKST